MKTYKIIEETEKAVKLLIRCYYVSKEGTNSVINMLTAEQSELKLTEYDSFVWCPKSAIDSEGNLAAWFVKQTFSKFNRVRGISFANENGEFKSIIA
jgi:hypothetical protein